MRSFLTYGAISLVGIAALYACGDDSGDGTTSTAGTGGQGGTAGGAGAGGSSGNTSMSGAGGGAGLGGSGGAGVVASCTGCVQIDVPFSAASQNALYQVTYPAPGLDFSNATVTWAVQLVAGDDPNLFAHIQIQNGAALAYAGYYTGQTTALTTANFPATQFVNVTVNMATVPGVAGGDAGVGDAGDAGDASAAPPAAGGFDKSKVESVQLQIGATAAFTGTKTTTVAVDSLTVTGVTGTTGATFNAGLEGLTLNNYPMSPTPPGTPPPVTR